MRARSAADGQLVGDRDPCRRQLATGGVAAPAPVLERRDPGAADRDVALPVAPGAPERVGDHAPRARRRGGRARPARIRRAEASGSTREQRPACPAPGALEASTPALAHTKPCRVTQIRTPRAARRSSWTRRARPERGAGPCRARRPARARRGSARRRPAPRRALGLGDDLVGDHDARRPLDRPPAVRGAARSAPRGRRRAAPRGAPRAPTRGRLRSCACCALSWLSMPRVCAAPPRDVGERVAAAASRSSGVSTSSASELTSTTSARCRGLRVLDVALAAARAERGRRSRRAA